MSAVFKLKEEALGPIPRLVLLALADFANDEGNHVYPQVARLVQKTGLCERSMRNCLDFLESDGWIVCIRDATPRRPKEYQISVPRLLEGCTARTPEVQDMHPRGAPNAPEPSLTIIEPPREQPAVRPDIGAILQQAAVEGRTGEGLEDDPKQAVKAIMPDTDLQRDFLEQHGAQRFPRSTKLRFRALESAIRIGSASPSTVCDDCIRAIAHQPGPSLNINGVPIPMSWYDWNIGLAGKYRWGIERTLDALYNREGLMKHCRRHSRERGATSVTTIESTDSLDNQLRRALKATTT